AVLIKDRNADDVRRQQVARELNALKTAIQTARDSVRQRSFTHAWNVLDEQMPAGQQGHNRQMHRFRFAANYALDGLLKLAQAMSSGSDQTSLTAAVGANVRERGCHTPSLIVSSTATFDLQDGSPLLRRGGKWGRI